MHPKRPFGKHHSDWTGKYFQWKVHANPIYYSNRIINSVPIKSVINAKINLKIFHSNNDSYLENTLQFMSHLPPNVFGYELLKCVEICKHYVKCRLPYLESCMYS